jgi:hypothetical protein
MHARLPAIGDSATTAAGDHPCRANDEARSVQLNGRLPRGLQLKIADDSNGSCVDDDAMIILYRDLLEYESVCVDSFEISCSADFQPGPDYKRWTFTASVGGGENSNYAGKASWHKVTNPEGNDSREPLCSNEPITFWDGENCSEDKKVFLGYPPLDPDNEFSISDAINNDEFDILQLIGPIPAGLQIVLSDRLDSGKFCDNHDVTILLKRELLEICIFSLELNIDNDSLSHPPSPWCLQPQRGTLRKSIQGKTR